MSYLKDGPIRHLVAYGSDGLSYVTVPPRPPADGELLISPGVSLVSPGTELHYIRRAVESGECFPLGYCSAGVVMEVGAGCGDFAVGDRVIAMGWGRAVHGTRIWVPFRLCVKIPPDVRVNDAVVANLAATAVHAIDRSGMVAGDEVLVVGAGIVGSLVAQVAAAFHATVTVVDSHPERVSLVSELGHPNIMGAMWETVAGGTMKTSARRHALICLSGDATVALRMATEWSCAGGGRPVVTAVGRFTALTEFNVDHGNIDYRISARCGEGYRDEAYELGLKDVTAPVGEATVTRNLERALYLIKQGLICPGRMPIYSTRFDRASEAYELLRDEKAWITARLTYGTHDD